MIDAHILDSVDPEEWSPLTLLAGLLTHDTIELVRFADDGPPATAERRTYGTGEHVPGWAVLGPAVDGVTPVTHSAGSVVSRTAIFGNATEIAAEDEGVGYPESDASQARRVADALAVQAAGSVGADLFITSRPYLHAVTWPLSRDVLIAHPADALRWSACTCERRASSRSGGAPTGPAPTASDVVCSGGSGCASFSRQAGDGSRRVSALTRRVLQPC